MQYAILISLLLMTVFFDTLLGALSVLTVAASPLPTVNTSQVAVVEKSAALEQEFLQASTEPDTAKHGAGQCELPAWSVLDAEQRAVFAAAILNIDCHLLRNLRTISFYDDPSLPRAMAGAFTLQLRRGVLRNTEAKQLLQHELGHLIDLGGLRGTPSSGASEFRDGQQKIWQDDLSLHFYRISWADETTWRGQAERSDFVTGYAARDVFEDFSESMTLYINHGRYFRQLARTNKKIAEKYQFFRDYVFNQLEFATGQVTTDLEQRQWDATRIIL